MRGLTDPPDPDAWIKVCEPGELVEGGVRPAWCAGKPLCMVRHKGVVTAFADECPHQGAPISNGWIWDGYLVCPWHGWAFDPHSGAASNGSSAGIPRHPVQERDDGIYVQARLRPRREPIG